LPWSTCTVRRIARLSTWWSVIAFDYEDAKDALARNEKENARGVYSDFDANYRGKVLQLHFTVEDEGVFTMPWTATITYRRALGSWTDLICAENLNEPTARKESAVPTAIKPDF
jgi:hypothetical protein